jgi:hypothetical protein
VHEILRRGCKHDLYAKEPVRDRATDLDAMKHLGLFSALPLWCYPVWARLLEEQPLLLARTRDIFARHPRSGCLEALEGALRGGAEGPPT